MNAMVMLVTGEEVSTIFSVLADRRRRYVLYSLREADEAVSTEILAVDIADLERDQPVATPPNSLKPEIHTDLIHTHLPKLKQANLVDYDRRTGDVRYLDPPSLLETCLCLAEEMDLSE